MKFLFSFLAIFMLNKECDQKKSADADSNPINSEKKMNEMQEPTSLWYQATTRGFYEKIWVTKDSITFTNDRNQKEKISYKTQDSDWNELMRLVNTIDIKTLPELEAPTAMRHYDGAAIATLSVVHGKDEIISNSFDHGHPPETIESIVNKVLSMKEVHQKN